MSIACMLWFHDALLRYQDSEEKDTTALEFKTHIGNQLNYRMRHVIDATLLLLTHY